MKLAFCLFKYFPYGGLQRDFLHIAKECLERGHQIDVFTMAWEGEKIPGLSIHIVPSKGKQNHIRMKHFADQLNVADYDLVVGFNKIPGLDVYYAADTCYQAKAKTQRGFFYRLLPRYRQLVANEAAVFSKQTKTEILLISQKQQPEFIQYYGTPAERFHLLPPGISKDRMAPGNAETIRTAMRNKLNIQTHEILLLLVGSGFKTKGLDRALRGVAALPSDIRQHTHFYIVGKDNPALFLKQAKKLGIAQQISFLGGRDDVPQLLLAGDVLLHPAYNENTGTVLLEALAAGLPVLTTDVCGYAHYIQDARAGRVIDSPFKQEIFNQELHQMLVSAERDQWRNNAIHFSRTADLYHMPQHAVDLLESFAGKTTC